MGGQVWMFFIIWCLSTEPIIIQDWKGHKSVRNTECDGFEEDTSTAKLKTGGENSLELGEVLFQVGWTYSCRKALTFFLQLLAKFLKTFFLFWIWSFWELEKLLFRERGENVGDFLLELEWTTTKSIRKWNLPFKKILFSAKILFSGCLENLDVILIPII